jgi:hypothetical protein
MKAHELAGWVSTFLKITGSTIAGKHSAVLVGGVGLAGGLGSVDEEDDGEQVTDAENYGGLGLVSRPRVAETIDGDKLTAEALGMRKAGDIVPVAWRDLRLNRRFPAPKPGTIALVGYGGGFLSFDDPADGSADGGAVTLYLPYAFSGGTPGKAHAITLSGDGESIAVVHGDGLALTMDPTNGITLRADNATYLNLAPGKFEVVAAHSSLRGNVALGADTSSAIPLLPGTASQPTPSVFFSPV